MVIFSVPPWRVDAIGEIDAAQRRELRVLGLIGHGDAEITTPAVEIERSRLERRLAAARVEGTEGTMLLSSGNRSR
jgi:hypothetical protein